MFNNFKYMAVAAALAVAPMTASAATLLTDDGSFAITYGSEFFGDLKSTGGAGDFTSTFTSSVDPLGAQALATIGPIAFKQFTNLTLSWLSAADMILSTTAITPLTTTLSTVFTAPNETQKLRLSWTDSTAGAGFDFEVAASVPVPAAGLLLMTALGGAAALRRRKNKA